MNRSRVLLTGASGFIGRHAIAPLRASGFDVHTLSRSPLPPDLVGCVTQHHADLLDHPATARVLDQVQPTHLLHLAWAVTPGKFWRDPANLDWVAASLMLYRAFAAAGGVRLVVAGTCAEYDWSHERLDESETPCRPATLYGAAKDALRRILEPAARQDGVSMAWGRLFFLYGPHEAPGRLVPDVALSLLHGKPALCGDGTAQRDFMAVQDAADAFAAVLAHSHTGPVNVASGRCVPLRDVISTIAGIAGRPDLVRLGARPAAPDDPVRMEAVTTLLSDTIGFHPAQTLDQGLSATVAWWRDHLADPAAQVRRPS